MPSFVTGTMVIDAPASALNNSGESIPNARTENTSSVKFIRANDGRTYPYVSAQAVRYWLRDTLASYDSEWRMSPTYREEKVAYTDANPIEWWDDDLLGYMCAPSKSKAANFERVTPLSIDDKGKPSAVTRVGPFRMGTLVSIAPVNLVEDFGVMARQEEDPVPFEHHFYRATLNSLFSLDLNMAGKFYYRRRSGYQNLDGVRRQLAEERGLEHIEAEKAFRLPQADRIKRARSLVTALGLLQGGAKRALHYTDVTPAVTICAVTSGGNHPFNYLFTESRGALRFDTEVFKAAVLDCRDRILSPIHIGWKHGYAQELRQQVQALQVDGVQIEFATPSASLKALAQWLETNAGTWDQPS